ncbi:MAG: phosphoribosyltransferase [Candidatus Sumerlaeia bacterium]
METDQLFENTQIRKIVDRPQAVFDDRSHGGKELAGFMELERDADAVVLALPRGGIPVGAALANALGAPLYALVVRKLPVPLSPETGFGAVALGCEPLLNTMMIDQFNISEKQQEKVIEEVRQELRRRALAYNGTEELPPIEGRKVYLVDDGLATGYTVLAASKLVEKSGVTKSVLAVPVSPLESLRKTAPAFNEVYCLFAQRPGPFAVASFYMRFPDLSDSETKEILNRYR